jgi:hypothetical protein
MFIAAIIWTIICVYLAGKKGKDEVIAGVMGFILGFFAFLYYAFCEDKSIKCPTCKEVVKKDATICPHCHKKLDK